LTPADEGGNLGAVPTPQQLAKRGGLVRVRTVKLPNGRYRHVYVVRDPGPRGGHTMAGETKARKHGARPRRR